MNDYFVEKLVEARLAEARARSARLALLSSLRADGAGLVVRARRMLRRSGRWIAQGARPGGGARGQHRVSEVR
jgi:hypothetical protein